MRSGCYKTAWPADKGPRLSGAQGNDGKTYTVHQAFRVYYSPQMAQWMQTNRPDGRTVLNGAIPDGAAMVAEIFQGNAGGPGAAPTGYLVMIRQSGAPRRPTDPLTGWFWSQVVTAPGFMGTIGCLAEQLPDPNSRVQLSSVPDALGIPRPQMSYRIDECGKRSLSAAVAASIQVSNA